MRASAAEPAGVITGICFHGIGTPPTGLEPGWHEYFVSAELLLAVLDEAAVRPGISLTFDDGNASDVEVALPALRERGLTATFFPVAGKLGQPGYLDAAGVRALSAAGMRVGSHGMWHRSWRDLDTQTEREELAVARSLIGSVRDCCLLLSVMASWCAAGRSQNRTGTPARSAYLIACHSGENTANGQNAAVFGCPGTYPSNATGGRISGSRTSSSSASASGGPSISTTSGSSSARASRNDRADPGP